MKCISPFLLAVMILACAFLLAPAMATTTCDTNGTRSAAQLAGTVSGTSVQLNWNVITDPGFSGYKVVISKNNPNPKYPDDGYLYFITDGNQNSATVDGSATYNGGDIGGNLVPGQTYYFSITTLYCDGPVQGNSISLTFPGTPAPAVTETATPVPTATATPVVTATATPAPTQSTNLAYRSTVVRATADGDHIDISWNRITDPRLLGYRVVASQYDLAPAYPEDGYLFWITDPNQNSATIDNSTPYIGGDIGSTFQPDITYSFSVTAVYSDGTVAGNAVRLKYSAKQPAVSPQPAEYAVPVLTGSADSGHVRLSWNDNSDRHILGYRLLVSRTNPDPRYGNDRDAILVTGRDQHAASFDTTSSYYGGDFSGRFRPGTYYIRVIAIYPDRIVYGRVIRITVPDKPVVDKVTPVPTVTTDYPVPHVTGTVDGSKIRLSWDIITDSRFQGYKVVISKSNPNPKYPDDGYLYYITDRNQHTATVDAKSKYNGGDIGGHLIPGQTYYFSVTALYQDRKVAGNAIALVFPGTPSVTPTATPVVTATATPVSTTTPCTTATPEPTETTPSPEETTVTATPTPVITAEPTQSVFDLITEQNHKIDAQNRLIAEQNRKLAEQSGILDRLLAFLRTLFRF